MNVLGTVQQEKIGTDTKAMNIDFTFPFSVINTN